MGDVASSLQMVLGASMGMATGVLDEDEDGEDDPDLRDDPVLQVNVHVSYRACTHTHTLNRSVKAHMLCLLSRMLWAR